MPPLDAKHEHIHFITGRLAERALQSTVGALSAEVGFTYTIEVLPITVAALMTVDWIQSRWRPPDNAARIVLPGYCQGDIEILASAIGTRVERGPRDLRELPSYFAMSPPPNDYGAYQIEILAEINHAPRLTRGELLAAATELSRAGADVIDVGCEPGSVWNDLGDAICALRDAGHRVSIDSFDPREVAIAVRAGAELVLSVHGKNCVHASDWGVEVVAIPEDPADLDSLDKTVEFLSRHGVTFRIDPILEPIGFGFSQSLGRYLEARRRYPEAAMLMGVGNLTELTDVDSAGVNALLLGFCQEQAIGSVLTTQVINWARTSVRECDIARRLVFHAVSKQTLPKRLDSRLVMLRDAEVVGPTVEDIAGFAAALRDNNYRIFVAGDEIHLTTAGLHLHDADPFVIMQALETSGPKDDLPRNLTPNHAFYLGFEMAKAATALTLGKTYRQDEALNWGLATRPEVHRRLRRKK